MLKVLCFDLRAAGPYGGLVLLVWTAGAASFWRVGPVYFWWTVGLAAALALVAPGIEWKARADIFLHSLPVSRAQVVRGRYLGAAVAVAVSAAAGAAVAAGFGALSASYGRPAALWVSPEALTAFAVAGLFVTAIIVTSVSVFGLGPGLAVGLTITMLAARANGGWAGDGSGPADLMAPSRAAGGAVQHAIESSVQAAGWPVTVLAALAASGAVVVLGAAAATRAARRREF